MRHASPFAPLTGGLLLAALCLLAGCGTAHDETRWGQKCSESGLKEGSPEHSRCVSAMRDRYEDRIEDMRQELQDRRREEEYQEEINRRYRF